MKPEVSDIYQSAAYISGASPVSAKGLSWICSNIAPAVTTEAMQSSKMDLRPHDSTVLREWKLLRNTIATVTPINVDTDYLGVATITAVSK